MGNKVRCPKCAGIFVATAPSPEPNNLADIFASNFNTEDGGADEDPFLQDAPRAEGRRRRDYYDDDEDVPLPENLQGQGLGLGVIAVSVFLLAIEFVFAVLLMRARHHVDRGMLAAPVILTYLFTLGAAKTLLAFWVYAVHDNLRLFRIVGVTILPRVRFIQTRVGRHFFFEGQLLREAWKGSDPGLVGIAARTAWKKQSSSPVLIVYLLVRVLRVPCVVLALMLAAGGQWLWGAFLVPSVASTICLAAVILLTQARQKKKLKVFLETEPDA